MFYVLMNRTCNLPSFNYYFGVISSGVTWIRPIRESLVSDHCIPTPPI